MRDTILWTAESDRYTARAKELHHHALYTSEIDSNDARTLAKLRPIKSRPVRRILDIGCGYGALTAALAREFPRAHVVGVDPGKQTVALARRSLRDVKNLSFVRGFSHDLALDEPFDIVVLRMVLQWVPRQHLLQTAAEIDRLCRGFVYIQDFYPSVPMTSVSRHDPAIRIFKQDYAAIFTGLPFYRLAYKRVEDAQYGEDFVWARLLVEKRSLDRSYRARKGVRQADKARRSLR